MSDTTSPVGTPVMTFGPNDGTAAPIGLLRRRAARLARAQGGGDATDEEPTTENPIEEPGTPDTGADGSADTGDGDQAAESDGNTPEEVAERDSGAADSIAVDEGYDPSAHTVAEVQQYLADNPDQSGYVLDRERSGKARTTLIGA